MSDEARIHRLRSSGQPMARCLMKFCASDHLTRYMNCSLWINGIQELVKPDKVGMRLARPLAGHDQRRARRFGLERPSAHPSTSASSRIDVLHGLVG